MRWEAARKLVRKWFPDSARPAKLLDVVSGGAGLIALRGVTAGTGEPTPVIVVANRGDAWRVRNALDLTFPASAPPPPEVTRKRLKRTPFGACVDALVADGWRITQGGAGDCIHPSHPHRDGWVHAVLERTGKRVVIVADGQGDIQDWHSVTDASVP